MLFLIRLIDINFLKIISILFFIKFNILNELSLEYKNNIKNTNI